MNIKELLYTSLTGIRFKNNIIPVSQIKSNSTNNTYITYYCLLEDFTEFADDENTESTVYFTINIFTKHQDFDSLVKIVKDRLKKAGFILTSIGPEIYEDKENLYHIVIETMIENYEEEI